MATSIDFNLIPSFLLKEEKTLQFAHPTNEDIKRLKWLQSYYLNKSFVVLELEDKVILMKKNPIFNGATSVLNLTLPIIKESFETRKEFKPIRYLSEETSRWLLKNTMELANTVKPYLSLVQLSSNVIRLHSYDKTMAPFIPKNEFQFYTRGKSEEYNTFLSVCKKIRGDNEFYGSEMIRLFHIFTISFCRIGFTLIDVIQKDKVEINDFRHLYAGAVLFEMVYKIKINQLILFSFETGETHTLLFSSNKTYEEFLEQNCW